ncbi:hypothetical protein C8J56DRAFT_884069 [Mycena floridula]|nr:hypothetical protein C8J56DRAFT_884069 [Mycena floridula]
MLRVVTWCDGNTIVTNPHLPVEHAVAGRSGFHEVFHAALSVVSTEKKECTSEYKTYKNKVMMEEVEDEDLVAEREKEKVHDSKHYFFLDEEEEKIESANKDLTADKQEEKLYVPPTPIQVFKIPAKRSMQPDRLAVGISVFSVKGAFGQKEGKQTDLRINSCTDISLTSSDFYHSLEKKPKLKTGVKM